MKKQSTQELAALLSETLADRPRKRARVLDLEGAEEVAPAAPAPPDNQLPANDTPVQSSRGDNRQVVNSAPVQMPASTPPQTEPLLPESHSLTIDYLLPSNAPHLRTPYVTIDRFRQLSPGPRAVCEEIYRAAAGWHSDECVISVSKLALHCKIDEKYVRKYLAQLHAERYIDRLGNVQGGSDLKARGIRFRILLPRMSPPDKKTPVRLSGGDNRQPNKESIKETKKGIARLTPEEIQSLTSEVSALLGEGKQIEELETAYAPTMHPVDWATVRSTARAQAVAKR